MKKKCPKAYAEVDHRHEMIGHVHTKISLIKSDHGISGSLMLPR